MRRCPNPAPVVFAVLLLCPLLAMARPVLAQSSAASRPAPADLFRDFRWRNIGPSNMMGRISAVDALYDDFRTVVVGSASGGVWLSRNAGASFEPIFDAYGSQSIGDVAFFQPDPKILWVGTGEATNRNSVGWGDGVYKSSDGGETFTHVGLLDSYQIGEIETHPTDSLTVYVAALGNLWGTEDGRGLYKTTDGGRTWTKLTNGLPDDGRVGATDVEVDPSNPEVVYVGMYDRLRRPWSMRSGGPQGGIFKSVDGGRSWRELTNGLPPGETGQIDIDLYRADPRILVAYVEASDELPHDMSRPGPGIYRSDDGGESWRFLYRHTSRPYYHGQVRIHPADERKIWVVSREFAYSEDGGRTFTEGRNFSSGGGDDHDMWISPHHDEVIYSCTDQGLFLALGGDAHVGFLNMAVGQYYDIGVDMRDPYWVYGGLQDNGGWAVVSNSRDRGGIRVDHAVEVNGGDGFDMRVDPTDWRTVYTTVHVGYFGRIDMRTRERAFITPTPATTTNFREVYDPSFRETMTEYTINPGEYWLWRDLPDRSIDGSALPPQFRFNWNSPLVLSPHDPRTVYVGSSYLFRSRDRGESWEIISPDLTRNDPRTRNSSTTGGLTRDVTGAENHHTIYTIAESPLNPGEIWVGTDDGNVHVTRDGGRTWRNLRANFPGLPDTIWVSEVAASYAHDGTAYVTFDNHRMGDTAPYVFRTTDWGETWEDLSATLPRELPGASIHSIAEDPVNANLLFVGTEFGVYASVDGGRAWHRFMPNLPPVAVRDLVIHPRDADLVAGTHGRAIWVLDDIGPLRQLTHEVLSKDAHLFESRVATKWRDMSSDFRTDVVFRGENPPRGASIDFYLREPPADSVTIEVVDPRTGGRQSWRVEAHAGINRARWDLRFPPAEPDIAAGRDRLRRIARDVARALDAGPDATLHHLIWKDLVSPHYAPAPLEGVVYPDTMDERAFVRTHVDAIVARLDSATTARALNRLRTELVYFSPLLGDRVFFDYFPAPLEAAEAAAGEYRVRVTVDGRVLEGGVRVREDPLLEGGR